MIVKRYRLCNFKYTLRKHYKTARYLHYVISKIFIGVAEIFSEKCTFFLFKSWRPQYTG